ncbi:MAG: DUF3299 domain-containing protein [Pirellulales bacterium]
MRFSRLAYCLLAAAGLPLGGCQENRLPGMTASSSPDDTSSRPSRGVADNSGAGQAAAGQAATAKSTRATPAKSQAEPSSKGQSSTGQSSKGQPATGAAAAEGEPARSNGARHAVAETTPGRALNINFDDIQFEMEKGGAFQRSMLSERIESLSGKKVRIRGYILPQTVFTQTGITQFVLVRDNMECCFGPGAMLYDCIVIMMNPGKSTDFTSRPIAVEGTFSVDEVVRDGQHLAIYRIDADSAG